MNTLEIKTKGIIKSWEDLYKYAYKQFVSYEKLEGIDNWKKYDFSIDCSEDQMKFKDMLQIRCIEELTEATHALDNYDHFLEEITDAINFFLSAYCMLGVDFNKFNFEIQKKHFEINYLNTPECLKNCFEEGKVNYSFKSTLYVLFYKIVNDIGNLCNLLKNRPWTQSNYLVSMLDFNERLEELWKTFWGVMVDIGLSDKMIFELFERKYLVNKWRMKTGY